MSELLLADSTECVDLVAENEEGNLGEFLDGEQCIKLGLRFSETFVVSRVDQEDDTVDLGEVVAPEATGYVEHVLLGT